MRTGGSRTDTSALPPRMDDRAWSRAWVSSILGPLDTADVDHLHARYEQLRRQLPDGHWLRAHPAPFATDVGDGDVLAHAVERSRSAWSGHPMCAFVGGGHVAVMYSHGVGDGATTRRLVRDLLAVDGTPFTMPELRALKGTELLTGAGRWWGRRPGTVRPAVHGLRDRESAATVTVDDVRPVVAYRRLGTQDQARLRARRDRERPGVSTSMALLADFLDALARRDVRPARVSLAADIRRYLRHGPQIGGNLAAVLQLPVPDARVRAAVASGQPLLQFLLSIALSRRTVRRPAGTPADAVPTLGWSDRGRVDEWEDLPWGAGPRTVLGGLTPVIGPRMSVHLGRVAGVLHIALSVNAAAFDAPAAVAALDETLGTEETAPSI